MRAACSVFLLLITLSGPALAALECRTTEVAGTSSGHPSETAARQAAHRAWEKQARSAFGASYTWLMALESGRGLHHDSATRQWAAWVQGYPCRMLSDDQHKVVPGPCAHPTTAQSAQINDCPVFYLEK